MHNRYLEIDEWKLIETSFDQEHVEDSESLFSIGNGHMGQRANFEEDYSGQTLQGSYIAGVYYPDKTRVGWWKNGYPEYFAKVLNSCNWIGIRTEVEGESLDLNRVKILDFYRELDMKQGLLTRRFTAEFANGRQLKVEAQRFVSMALPEVGAIQYSLTPLNFSGKISCTPYLDFDVRNKDANYDEKFWEEVHRNVASQKAVVVARTRKLGFEVAASMRYELYQNGDFLNLYPVNEEKEMYVANRFTFEAEEGKTYRLQKYAALCSSLDHEKALLAKEADHLASEARRIGFDQLKKDHIAVWEKKWERSDIRIEGDAAAQQGIRFNIFQLNQTYTGDDPRLNIGPKGFTGEKYGGSTYWDTEAYCLPFYLATAKPEVARNLLLYRYRHLGKAIENAEKLGFTGGAALYPMVTMNGEECHNEWEITFEEIHRNAAIAYGIYNYVRHTLDRNYLAEAGLEVLIGIARFWAQRVNWSEAKQAWVMLGVTGPNEYENNVNNNWYTNRMAVWCLEYTLESLLWVKENRPERYAEIQRTANFREEETTRWKEVMEKMYFPEDREKGIFLQQDGFLDKELMNADQLNPAERPINQHWSWDRILRSCFIKQADVLQGLYFLEDRYDTDTLERNFDFYEPKTVHESSLSPCVHVVLAARLNRLDKAYELYLRTSRLDLDDYNLEVHEGLHITSMAGTWMSVTQGFGGMRIVNEELEFNPRLPDQWQSLSFNIYFRGAELQLYFGRTKTRITNASDTPVSLRIAGEPVQVKGHSTVEL